MKGSPALIATTLVLAASFAALAGEPTPPAPSTILSASAQLKDGSKIKGEFKTEKISGSTAFAKHLALNAGIVMSISFTGQKNEANVVLTNGDTLKLKVADKSFKMATALGTLDVPRRNIRSLTLSKSRKAATVGSGVDDTAGLVFHCTFDDEAAITAPAVGPSVKLELGKIVNGKGKKGGALFVNPGIAGAQITFPADTFGSEGCIEFWANMASGKTEFTTGGDPRFFILSTIEGTEISHFEYASNNGCGNSGLGGHFCGMRTQTNSGCHYLMPYSDVFKGEDYNGWHHYAFVWSPTQLTIYVDGKMFCQTNGQLNTTQMTGEVIMDIPLSRTNGKSFNNKSAFYMDELKIWNFAKNDFDLF